MTGPTIISLADVRASYLGPSLDLAPHRNAAATLVIALDGAFELKLAPVSQGWTATTATKIALIPAGMRQHLRCHGLMAFIYLDAASDDVTCLPMSDLEMRRRQIVAAGSASWRNWNADEWCEQIGLPHRLIDSRIATTARAMAADPDRFTKVAAAALHAGLSASRFQALFRQTYGTPFRRWRVWRRLVVAVTCMARGMNVTGAAHQAGFASSAHFSTACRAMFGISPSTLLDIGADIRISDVSTRARELQGISRSRVEIFT